MHSTKLKFRGMASLLLKENTAALFDRAEILTPPSRLKLRPPSYEPSLFEPP